MLEDLRALVEFAHAGSIAGAADRLFRTPSAITRQVQRLEAALGAELLDRSVKPPRLNSLGSRGLEQARDLLQRTEALKSLTSSDAEPHGLLRIGLAHALAEGTLIEPIRALTEKADPGNERSLVRRQRCMCFYLRYLFAGSLLADDNEIRHALSLNTYNNFILKKSHESIQCPELFCIHSVPLFSCSESRCYRLPSWPHILARCLYRRYSHHKPPCF